MTRNFFEYVFDVSMQQAFKVTTNKQKLFILQIVPIVEMLSEISIELSRQIAVWTALIWETVWNAR